MVIHESAQPKQFPPHYHTPANALGALIAEMGDPCARCTVCHEGFLLSAEGYHPHLLGPKGNFLFASDQYNHIEGAILYDWMPVTRCVGCQGLLSEVAGETYGYGGDPISF